MNPENSHNAPKIGVELTVGSFNAVKLDGSGERVADRFSATFALENVTESLTEFVSSLKPKFGEFEQVGIAVPGLVESRSGQVAFSAVVPGLSSVNLADAVRASTGVAAVVENDANAAAFGEYLLGAGRGSSSMFYATIGTGVGGAFISNGELWRGANGFAGEFGYMTISAEGLRLEDVASSENIVRRTIDRFNRDSTSSLASMSESEIDVGQIIRAAEAEDDFARLMLERTGAFVGTALASVINLLNIETVVLGGELLSAGELVIEPIIEKAKEFSFGPSFGKTKIVPGSLESAAAVGAAIISGRSEKRSLLS